MLKARLHGQDGSVILLLGLEAENVKRLREGKPIHVSLAELGYGDPHDAIVIFYGETPQAMLKELRGHGLDVPVVPPGPVKKRENDA